MPHNTTVAPSVGGHAGRACTTRVHTDPLKRQAALPPAPPLQARQPGMLPAFLYGAPGPLATFSGACQRLALGWLHRGADCHS